MPLFEKGYFFYVSALLVFLSACGPMGNSNSEEPDTETGSYRAKLLFPEEFLHSTTRTKALASIDCSLIAALEFTINDTTYSAAIPCEDHRTTINGIPAANDVRVDVYASNSEDVILLHGTETIDIKAGVDNVGGYIEMIHEDGDDDGSIAGVDCNDNDASIYPGVNEWGH